MAYSRKYQTEIVQPSAAETSNEPLTLMLLGKTGNGKSSLGNALLGSKTCFKEKSGLLPNQDYEPRCAKGKIYDREVEIIDTPGVLDNINLDKAVKGICSAISLCPNGVTAFVIVLRADIHFTEQESEAVTQLQTMFGDKFWNHAICVFTHGDAVKDGRNQFDAEIDTARAKLPNLNKLLSSVGTRVALVNCREMKKSDLMSFVMLLDSVYKLNDKKKYTNDMFKEARLRYETEKGADLMTNYKKAKQKLRKLEDENSKQTQVKIAELQKQVKEQEEKIKELQEKAAKSAETGAPKPCAIL